MPSESRKPGNPRKLATTGIVLLLLSSALLYIPAANTTSADGFFLLNYGFAIVYFFFLLANDRLKRNSDSVPHIFLLLILALISSYALNSSFPIFEPSTTWWAVVLVVSCLNYTAILFFYRLPALLRYLICFITGISFVAFLYMACYLLPLYVMGAITALILGFSLHIFVPALFVTYTVVFIRRATRIERRIRLFFFAGLVFSLGFIAQYVVRWKIRVNALDRSLSAAKTAGNNLPAWVNVAEDCTLTTLDESILRTDFSWHPNSDASFDWVPRQSFADKQVHDPLIVMATFFCGTPRLTENEQTMILKALFYVRHKAQQRIHIGEHLITSEVSTDVQLWPQFHLSYTEENITIANPIKSQPHRSQSAEALYTFHLPEGAVVSAFSLWIDGRERKAMLRSRHEADSTYTTIVGAYRLDPSVVQWQEGNTVVVRIFPVSTETRRFKLGITAPLEKLGQKLAYHSIGFDGPDATAARSSIRILPMQRLIRPEWPAAFQSDSTSHLRYPPSLLSIAASTLAPIRQDGVYTPDWILQCEDPGIETATFVFAGKKYTTATPTPAMGPTSFRQVYLDLNSSWTVEEYESLLSSLADFPVYASPTGNDLVSITSANKNAVFATCAHRLFSLFPLARITDPEHSLVISKSSGSSPNLADLNGSPFAQRLRQWLDKGGQVTLYNIGDELSPYLRALRETGAFHYEKGDLYTLQSHLHHNSFPLEVTAVNEVRIDPAGLLIRRTDDPGDTTPRIPDAAGIAPDHLLRLFAYHRILQKQKGRLPGTVLEPAGNADSLPIAMAQEAGIVTPVSSYVHYN